MRIAVKEIVIPNEDCCEGNGYTRHCYCNITLFKRTFRC